MSLTTPSNCCFCFIPSPLCLSIIALLQVLDLVTKAIELSLTMRSQNAEIVAQVIPSETDFDPEKMVPAHKSKEGGKVKVCVMPCFVDTNGVVVGKAKVFCG